METDRFYWREYSIIAIYRLCYIVVRELRIQHRGRPYRVLYAFDPRRTAILLVGGSKKGDDRWYEINIAIAEKLYTNHLAELMEQGLIDDKEVS